MAMMAAVVVAETTNPAGVKSAPGDI